VIGPPLADALRVIQVSLTPVALAAAVDTTEVQYTVPGVTVKDFITVSGPAPSAHVGIVGVRVVAPNTVAIAWGNFTNVANVPPSGVYTFMALEWTQ